MRYSRITGTGSYLPPRRVTNADLAAELAANGIETTDQWIVERTGIRARHFAAPDVTSSELGVRAADLLSRSELDRAVRTIGERWPGLDAVVQTETVAHQPRRLIALDMDSTLITVETMNEIARVAGIAEQVTPITTRANLGVIDFDESLRQRVALLKGCPEAPLRALAATTPLTPGAELLVSTLRHRGHRVAVLSAGRVCTEGSISA